MAESLHLRIVVPERISHLYPKLEKLVYSTMYKEDPEAIPIINFIEGNPPTTLGSLQYRLRKELNITRSIEGIEHIVKMCDLPYIQ